MQKKHISILAMKNANYASVVDARAVFLKVNEICRSLNKPALFQVQIVGETDEVSVEDGLIKIIPDVSPQQLATTDMIIIPAIRGDMISNSHHNRLFVDFIIRQYKLKAEVASLCTGAFMLAFTGLLKAKKCTTHWNYAKEFRFYYPDVTLLDEKIIVEQNGLFSSGGGTSYWNLLLFLVEKFTGREMAILVSKHFVVSLDKMTQTPFIVFNGLREHKDEVVRKAQEYIEQNYQERITVNNLSEQLCLTRRTFERRFKKATHCTIIEYLQKVRIEASKKALEMSNRSIDDIMVEVGYLDSQTFRDLFKRITGLTLVEYRDKYKK